MPAPPTEQELAESQARIDKAVAEIEDCASADLDLAARVIAGVLAEAPNLIAPRPKYFIFAWRGGDPVRVGARLGRPVSINA
ncbi:MAG: hypothetical protein JRH17_22540 [Deltaproteobacteria bacterium]|nr:hypothetical protein [Deltaproteobacteria bacterium]